MGVTDHSRFGDAVMQHQRAFHFGGTDTVAGYIDHIVDAPGDPVVAIGIAAGTVASEVIAGHGLEVGVDHALVVAIDATDLPRPAGLDDQQSGTGAFDQLAFFVQ
ncbi:hypothetical protein D9M73_184180 [compost metagenome]